MPRLNIPLHNNKTAHRNRWAVWNFVFFITSCVIAWMIIFGWFTRDSLASFAPADTEVAIHLSPNRSSWPILLNKTQGVPLVSRRAITLTELAPYIEREISIFVRKGGEQTIAYRGQMPNELRVKLESLGLVVDKPNRNTILIHTKKPEISQIKYKISTLDRYDPRLLGSIFVKGNKPEQATPIKLTKDSLNIKLNTAYTPLKLRWGANPALALELSPLLINDASINLVNAYSSLNTSPLLFFDILENLKQGGGRILLKYDKNSDILLHLEIDKDTENVISEEDITRFHKYLAAQQEPNINSKTLSDGTNVFELIFDPDQIQVERNIIDDKVALQSKNLITVIEDTKLIFANTPELLVSGEENKALACSSERIMGLMNPTEIQKIVSETNIVHHPHDLIQLLSNFVEISLDKQGKNTKIVACLN